MVFGQVVSKTLIRPYGSNNGVFFSFDVMDESTTLRVKAFNQECDRMYPIVAVGKVTAFQLHSFSNQLSSFIPV